MTDSTAYWIDAARSTREAWAEALRPRAIPANVASGISTALVAIPLNVALALAAGLPASVGLWTGAVAGIVGALLGGAKLQVTGPEVALAPLTLAIVSEHGVDGLLVCTVLAGGMQIAIGALRLGRFVQAVPAPVVLGFMVAVGLMVIDAQLPRLLGLPAHATSIVRQVAAVPGASLAAAGVGALVLGIAFLVPRIEKRLPAPLLALGAGLGVTLAFGLDVPRVPAVEGLIPELGLPAVGLVRLGELLPSAIALALLASLDSLLSAVSVDARLGTRHRSDQELVAQGVANLTSGLVGGMPVAGAIVRSVAAIEAGGTNRLAPVVQSLALGVILLVLGGSIHLLPVTALAAILIVVGIKLLQPRAFLTLYRRSRPDAVIAVVTVVAILGLDFVLGVALGVAAALVRMAVSHARPRIRHRDAVTVAEATVIHVEGPLHFASHDAVSRALAAASGPSVVLDLTAVPVVDLTAADALGRAVAECGDRGVDVWIGGAREAVAEELGRARVRVANGDLGLSLSLDRVLARLAASEAEAKAKAVPATDPEPLVAMRPSEATAS